LVQAGLSHTRPHPRISQADLRRLQRAIPVDTRDLTGRFFGDPIPGRSALDRKLGGLP
jgi:hypothetical protein